MSDIIINDISPIVKYTASGGELGFSYPFPIFDEDDLLVQKITSAGVVTTLDIGVDYTVSGVDVVNGGSIVLDTGAFPNGATATDRYVLSRDAAIQRLTDFLTGGDFKATVVNKELDLIIMMLQQNERDVRKALTLQIIDTETEINFDVQTAAERAGLLLQFNAVGTGVTTGPSGADITNAAANATAAAASAAAAAASETQAAIDAAAAAAAANTIANRIALFNHLR